MKKGSTHSTLIVAFFVVVIGALFFFFSQMGDTAQPTGAQVFEPPVFYPAVVTLLNITPNNVSQASTLEYTLTGIEFNSSAVVSTSNPDVAVLSTIIVNDTAILVNMTVAINASTGLYDVIITQDNESSTLASGLEIYEGPFDPASLINLSADYFAFNYTTNSTEPVTLIYNITTAPGVDKSIVNVTGGYAEVTDINTTNVTIINLTNATDPEGTFTLTFEPTIFYEEGDYEVELYLDLEVDEEYVDREYYGPYFGVGAPTCTLLPPCNFVGTVGVPGNLVVNIADVIGVVTICQLLTPPAGCAAVIGPGDACTINCNSPVAGVFNSGLTASDSASFCVPFPFLGGLPCTFTFSAPPPAGGGGGSGGNTNSYTTGAICPAYCKDSKYDHVAICASPACQAAASISAGPPPGVTYSGPSPVKTPVPKNEPINIQMPPEVPAEHRTVALPPEPPRQQVPLQIRPPTVPIEELRPPTVPIEQLERYRTLQSPGERIVNGFVNFVVEIKDLFVAAPVRAPSFEAPMLFARQEAFEEWRGDILIIRSRAMAVNPAAQVIARNNPDPEIAVGPDDILVVK